MFVGEGEGTGMMVGIGSGVGSGHMITVRVPDKRWREGWRDGLRGRGIDG